ncbi:TIGR02391 family protein [Kitasatospora kifunensis]|uniref:Conserved hypothetical protein CHP02391 domain-containing protein n=1 Tax=Kitasatospora kifunensis TaxID=58351 RepID=A0A7W7R3A8_KITKI|nr:TIGR02391 family protein [Kitasatospora kifunensis]MBB4924576.1 hypothetical protein [Kitasatospora kifunensis]
MNEEAALSAEARDLLQAVYTLMGQRGAWPTFTAVDLLADHALGIEDAQAALAALPATYMFRPWRANGFFDTDEVRLTLRGVALCDSGPDDLALLEQFMSWIVILERDNTDGSEEPLLARSQDFAAHLGLSLGLPTEDEEEATGPAEAGSSEASTGTETPTAESSPDSPEPEVPPQVDETRAKLTRLRVLSDLLPSFWTSASQDGDKPWLWQFAVDHRRVRPYRRMSGVHALLDYVDSEERTRRDAAAALIHNTPQLESSNQPGPAQALVLDGGLEILLTLLREEIADSCAKLVRADLFDEAIFAAFRRVEHEVQQRTGNPAISTGLIKAAFKDMKDPIRISDRDQDMDRMVELFAGAIGLFKGDRSHKDRPLLPCRSRRECLRLLAHASSLLDLLDRDIDRAPSIRGYQHRQGDILTLWVERAGDQVHAWLDETTQLTTHSFRPGTMEVDVTGIPVGEHRIHLVEGTRQGAAHTVWLTRDPGRSVWYRVVEVDVPLYADALGQQQLAIAGVRLAVLEAGVASERVLPTRKTYQVGHYVEWRSSGRAESTGPAWVRDRFGGPLHTAWDSSALFDGQAIAPAHEERLMRISFEPEHFQLRSGDQVPLRVLGHYTDGTATWTLPLDDPKVETSDEKVAVFQRGGAVIAKPKPGTTKLRCLYAGCYAEASIDVAAHPRGTVTEFLTDLPPTSGVAWTPQGLVVSTRGRQLWRVEAKDNVYRLLTAVPQLSATDQGTDTLAAREDGELAVRLVGDRRILVLHHHDGYRSSEAISPEADGVPMAFAWDGNDLLVTMHTGVVCRVTVDGTAEAITTVPGCPVAAENTADALLVLCAPDPSTPPAEHRNALWRIPHDKADSPTDLLENHNLTGLNGIAMMGPMILLSDFNAGRILRLHDGRVREVATGLTNPGQLTVSPSGDIYVAEFGAGAIRRIIS